MTFDEKDSEQIDLFADKDVQKLFVALQLSFDSVKDFYYKGIVVGFLAASTVFAMFYVLGIL